LVLGPYEYNMLLTVIFLKTYGEDTLRCPYKNYSSINGWQANRDLLSITTHRQQGKKVSVLLPGDMNSEPVPSR
jgi:hypothetical protein